MLGGPVGNLGNRNSQHAFSQIPAVNMARSVFDRSFAMKDTFNFDQLVPMFVDEMIPGDTANVRINTFARLATQLAPTMDNMYIDYFFFFVPNRLVWSNWEKFCGAQNNPGDSTDFVIPTVTTPSGGALVGSLYDKFGLPTQVAGLTINNLPARAYNLIWNEWFRDQNLQDSIVVDTDDGPDTYTDYNTLQLRGKRHDYFTSCLPFLQKAPAVELPLGVSAPVKWQITGAGTGFSVIADDPTGVGIIPNANLATNASGQLVNGLAPTQAITLNPNGSLYTDLSTATAATINSLRQAFQMQSLFELDARGGTRYVEILQAHYNVTSPDFRLQRPEFLGGGSQKISSHPVPQTSATVTGLPLATLGAFSTSASNGGSIGFTKSFVEHGYVIGMMAARADLSYQQGVNKMWLKSTRYDFFWPKLQELGEQAVSNIEIYAQGTSPDQAVFGYQERYSEYRYKPSEIHGEFRSSFAQTLDYWHCAEDFGSLPALNAAFIQSSTPIARIIYDDAAPALLYDMWCMYKHVRPLVTYSVPMSLGRF